MSEKKFVRAISKKSPEIIGKLTRKVLVEATEYWATEANEAFAASKTCGFQDRKPDEAELRYNESFIQWHLLKQTLSNFDKWRTSNQVPPGTEK